MRIGIVTLFLLRKIGALFPKFLAAGTIECDQKPARTVIDRFFARDRQDWEILIRWLDAQNSTHEWLKEDPPTSTITNAS